MLDVAMGVVLPMTPNNASVSRPNSRSCLEILVNFNAKYNIFIVITDLDNCKMRVHLNNATSYVYVIIM